MTDVEQITKEPEEKVEKVKDPKKVAAGKRLAAANKKSKEMLKEKDENSWIPDINFSTAIGIVGISLTVIDLYYRFSNREKKNEKYKPKLETIKEEPPQQQQKLIGML